MCYCHTPGFRLFLSEDEEEYTGCNNFLLTHYLLLKKQYTVHYSPNKTIRSFMSHFSHPINHCKYLPPSLRSLSTFFPPTLLPALSSRHYFSCRYRSVPGIPKACLLKCWSRSHNNSDLQDVGIRWKLLWHE